MKKNLINVNLKYTYRIDKIEMVKSAYLPKYLVLSSVVTERESFHVIDSQKCLYQQF